MPLPLSTTVIAEKNKLNAESVFLPLLKIEIPGIAEPFRIAYNDEDVTWGGATWVKFDFKMEEIGEESKGEVPQVVVGVSNVARVMEAYLEAYDQYTKLHGYSPVVVTAYVVNSLDLASGTPVVEHEFELVKPTTDSLWATFTLGASNPFNQRFPRHRILKDHCRFDDAVDTLEGFRGPLCKYAGPVTECNRTLFWCRLLGNSSNFGGSPGAGLGGLRLVK